MQSVRTRQHVWSGDTLGARRNFPVQLRRRLNERGLSQRSFAEAVGVTEAVVSQWLNSKGLPAWDRLDDIAKVLRCEPAELILDPESDLAALVELRIADDIYRKHGRPVAKPRKS